MKTRTYELKSISDIMSFGIDQVDFWFRGHTKVIGELTPSVFRGDYKDYKNPINPFNPEKYFYLNFKRIAPSRTITNPSINSNLEWLCLMQHHGLPTRLLDWSKNILVALYFAVYDDFNCNSELFAMYPYVLNKKYNMNTGYNKLPNFDNDILQDIANQPFDDKRCYEQENIYPMAFLPILFHPRLAAQESAFTIHPNCKNDLSIVSILETREELFRIIIPSNKKKGILKDLNNLGINNATLFPDLSGLAKSLKEGFEYFGVGGNRYVPDIEKIFTLQNHNTVRYLTY